jgi:hypothetical protein
MAGALLASAMPGVVSASRVTRLHEERLSVGCGADVDGTFVDVFIERSSDFGDLAEVRVFPPGEEEEPSLFGSVDSFDLSTGAEIDISVTIPLVDAASDPAGDADLSISLTPFGEPFVDEGNDTGNANSHTRIVVQELEGTGTISLPGMGEVELACFGDTAEGEVFQNNPTATTFHGTSTGFNCAWETESSFAFVDGQSDFQFGDFVDAGYASDALGIGTDGPFDGTIDRSGVDATLHLIDFETGDEYSATVEASFSPLGEPVTSVIVAESVRERRVDQQLSISGTFDVAGLETFTMDDEACFAFTSTTHVAVSRPAGPTKGKALPNDGPDGAIALAPGSRLNVQTTGTAPAAEVPNLTCDDGEIDLMGHTVWYTVEGTGEELTFDTSGSNFDTVAAVYVMDGDEVVEIACEDDVFGDPGVSLQAVITGPTEAGVTYWIQVGGWGGAFDDADKGRLRVKVR